MSEPTKGPWTVELIGQDDVYGHVYISGHITSPLHTYCGNDKERTDSITAPDSMTRADAYLIASAPMLRDALEQALVEPEHWCSCPSLRVATPEFALDRCTCWVKQARAALAASAPPPTADAGAEDGAPA